MISVVVPAYNEEAYIGVCLKNILQHKTEDVGEVIVVDNASTDRTAEIAASHPGVRVVREPQKGLLHARKRGLGASTGELILWLDADTQLREGWIAEAMELFTKHTDLVAVSGPYDYTDLPAYQRLFVWCTWAVMQIVTYWFTRSMIVGGNFIATRAALTRIGGFDTSIAFYGEDINIARRLKRVGRVIFSTAFFQPASGRRLRDHGVLRASVLYGINTCSEFVLHRPVTRNYEDIR